MTAAVSIIHWRYLVRDEQGNTLVRPTLSAAMQDAATRYAEGKRGVVVMDRRRGLTWTPGRLRF